VGKDAIHFANQNGYKFGLDSAHYYEFANYFFELKGDNTHLKKYYFLSNTIELRKDKISRRQFYLSQIPFERFMESDEFYVGEEWKEQYEEATAESESKLKATLKLCEELKTANPSIYPIMMNDLYYNGVVFENYYRDSLFINFLEEVPLPSAVKKNILCDKLSDLNTRGIVGIDRRSRSVKIKPYQLTESRKDVYKEAFKGYPKNEYAKIMNYQASRTTLLVEDGTYADSIPIIKQDLALYNNMLPDAGKITVMFIFQEAYYTDFSYKLFLMKELKKNFGERVKLVCLINWGRREAKHVVNNVMAPIVSENIPIDAYIMAAHLSVNFYSKSNLKSPWDIVVMSEGGVLPNISPKARSYFTYDPYERMALNYDRVVNQKSNTTRENSIDEVIYNDDIFPDEDGMIMDEVEPEFPTDEIEEPVKRDKKEEEEKNIGYTIKTYEAPKASSPSFIEQIQNLLDKPPNRKNEFNKFLDEAFNKGEGWYAINYNDDITLSKNEFTTVYATESVRWLIDPVNLTLHIYEAKTPREIAVKKLEINEDNGTIIIKSGDSKSTYKMLYYDKEYITLSLMK
jgi:hypothetical protein